MRVLSRKIRKNHLINKLRHITAGKVVGFLFLVLFTGFSALPLVYVVSTSLKPLDELFLFPPRFLVENPTLKNFKDLFNALDGLSVPFSRYIFNSLFVSLIVVFFTILVCTLAAYGITKHKVFAGNILFALVLSGLMVSPYVTRIPSFMIVNKLGMIDTHWSLIIPNIAIAYNMFLVKQFMEQIPDSFLEAARIDGASELRIFFTIVVPMLKPVIFTLALLSFVSNWNDYFTPLIYIQDEALKTLPVVMQNLSSNNSIARAGAMGAATLISIVPPILVYVFTQKNVVESMAYSGIKE